MKVITLLITFLTAIVSAQSTKSDGAVDQPYMSYLNLDGSQGAILTPHDLPRLKRSYAFTFGVWLKFTDLESFQKIFQLDDNFLCMVQHNQLTCGETQNSQVVLQIDLVDVEPLQWVYLSLASETKRKQRDGTTSRSYLQITKNNGKVVAQKSTNYGFPIVQNKLNWRACLGQCQEGQKQGFKGGVRGLILIGTYVDKERADMMKNYQINWNQNLMLYYRFSLDTFADDHIWNNKAQFVGGSEDDLTSIDVIPQDICPIVQSLQFFTEYGQDKQNQFENPIPLTTHFGWIKYNFEYSMTIKLFETEQWCSESDPLVAVDSCNILQIPGVMTLFKSTPNKARFFIDSQNAWDRVQTNEFDFPKNQWVTIQITLSKLDGYEIRTYDYLGRQMHIDKQAMSFEKQNPKRELNLMKNFIGYVSHFQLWSVQKELPMIYDSNEITDDNCIASFNLTQAGDGDTILNMVSKYNLLDEKQESYIPIINNPRKVSIPFVEYVIGTNDHGSIGTYDSWTPTLFDGISCKDDFMVFESNSEDSYISIDTPFLNGQLSGNLTIEFWMKIADESWDLQILRNKNIMSLTDASTQQTILGISVDYSGNFICDVLGRKVAYPYIDGIYKDNFKWFHFTCRIKSGEEAQKVHTAYMNTLIIDSNVEEVSLNGFNPQARQKLNLRIGKSIQGRDGIPKMQIKELRLWNNFRTDDQIRKSRQKLIHPINNFYGKDLLIYLQMNEDNNVIHNHANLVYAEAPRFAEIFNFYYQSSNTFISDPQSGKISETFIHLICPIGTQLSQDKCIQEPVQQFTTTVVPIFNETINQLVWRFSPYNTALKSEINWDEIGIEWKVHDESISEQYSSTSSKSLDIPQLALRDEQTYLITVKYSAYHSQVYKEEQLKFVPLPCQYFVANGSDAFSYYHKISAMPGTKNVTFLLSLIKSPRTIEGENGLISEDCPDMFYNKFKSIEYEFHVPGSDDVLYHNTSLDLAQINGDDGQLQFLELILTYGDQLPFAPFLRQDIQIDFKIFWTNEQYDSLLNTRDLLFQNVFYTLNFSPNDFQLEIHILQHPNHAAIITDTVKIDGSTSFLTGAEEYDDINPIWFKWICDAPFDKLCESSSASHDVQSIQITPDVFQSSGGEYGKDYEVTLVLSWFSEDGLRVSSNQTVSFSYVDFQAPEFSIVMPEKPILASSEEDQTIRLDITNIDYSGMRDYTIEWTLIPDITEGFKRFDSYTIPEGSLVYNQNYVVTVNIYHTDFPVLNNLVSYVFQTKSVPSGGSVKLDPVQVFFGDQVTASIEDWQTSYSAIQWRLWSTTSASGLVKNELIDDIDWMPYNKEHVFTASSIFPMIFEIKDSGGEVVRITVQSNVVPPSANSVQLFSILKSNEPEQLKLAILENTVSKDEDDFGQILEYLLSNNVPTKQAIKTLESNLQSQTSQQNIERALQVINQQPLHQVNSDYLVFQSFVNCLGSILLQKSIDTKIHDSILQILDETMDLMCEHIEQVKTDKIWIQTRSNKRNTERLNVYSKDSLNVTFNFEEIIQRYSSRSSEQTQDFQTCFRLITVLNGSQQILAPSIQMQGKNQVLANLNAFENIQLEFDVDKETFVSNQSVCMQFVDRSWSPDQCVTQEYFGYNQNSGKDTLICHCSMIQSHLVSIVKDESREIGQPLESTYTALINSQETQTSYLNIWIPMCYTLFFLYGRYLAKHLDSGIQSLEQIDVSNPKDKRIYEEYKKISGGQTLSTVQFVNYKQFKRTDKELDFYELLPRLHFGLGLFIDNGNEPKVMRLSKFASMLGVSILLISSSSFETDQFELQDLERAALLVIMGVLALQPYPNIVKLPSWGSMIWQIIAAYIVLFVCIVYSFILQDNINLKTFIIQTCCIFVTVLIQMTISEPLRIYFVKDLTLRASLKSSNPSWFTNSLVLDLMKNSELLSQAIETVEKELEQQSPQQVESQRVQTNGEVNDSFFNTLPSPSIEELNTQRTDHELVKK